MSEMRKGEKEAHERMTFPPECGNKEKAVPYFKLVHCWGGLIRWLGGRVEDCVAPVSGDISRRSFSRRGQEREGEGGGGGPIWPYIWVRPYARPEGGRKKG